MDIHHRLENAIRDSIEEIPDGKIFDSHFVIDQLLKKRSDVYLMFAGSMKDSPNKTGLVHAQIGHRIKRCGLVKRIGGKGEFSSENIRRKASGCAGWEKTAAAKHGKTENINK